MKTKLTALTILCFVAAGCPRSAPREGEFDVTGLSGAEAVAELGHTLCDYTAECGAVTYECSFGEGETECRGVIEPMSRAACEAEMEDDFAELFECADMDALLVQALNRCINALDEAPCPTRAEVDAMAQAMERGDESVGDPVNGACDEAIMRLSDCSAPSVHPEPDPGPEPDSGSGGGGDGYDDWEDYGGGDCLDCG